jgi:hypothetical protein
MDTFWAVRLFCTKPVSFQLRQFAAANEKDVASLGQVCSQYSRTLLMLLKHKA